MTHNKFNISCSALLFNALLFSQLGNATSYAFSEIDAKHFAEIVDIEVVNTGDDSATLRVRSRENMASDCDYRFSFWVSYGDTPEFMLTAEFMNKTPERNVAFLVDIETKRPFMLMMSYWPVEEECTSGISLKGFREFDTHTELLELISN